MAKYTVYGLPGVYNSVPLSLNDGDGVALAVTSAGQLIVVNADGSAVGAGIEYTVGAAIPGTIKAPSLVWSDGTNWQVVSTNKPLPVTATLSAETTKVIGTVNQGTSPWVVSGTVTANIGTVNGLALDATLTGGTQQTKITDGTNIASVLKSDGTAAAQNAQMIGGAIQTQAYSTGSSGALTALQCSGYSYVSIDIQTTLNGGGLTQFQISNDNTNWRALKLFNVNISDFSSGPGNTGNTYAGSLMGAKYFRLNLTGSGGTAAGTVIVSTLPMSPNAVGAIVIDATGNAIVSTTTVPADATRAMVVAAKGTGATGSAVPANAFYQGVSDGTNLRGVLGAANALNSTGAGIQAAQLVAQLDDTSPTTITENQFGNLRMTTLRELMVQAGLFPTGTTLTPYAVHLTANATTTPVSATVYISSIAISTEVAGTTSTVTIQDKQGTPLKLVNALTTVAATAAPQIYNFQTPVKMTSGIDIITAGAVASTIDVWINYYA